MNPETTYRIAFDVWKAQVDSYWTRASYNVVFQLALLTGFLKLNEQQSWGLIIVLSSVALVLTVVWFKTSERMNDYIRYYWRRLIALEKTLEIPFERQIFATLDASIPERTIKHRTYVLFIPRVFGVLWIIILARAICLCHCR